MITYELPPPATSAPAASRWVPSGQVTVTPLSEELDALLALTICRFGTAADAGPGALVTTATASRTVLTNAAGHRMNSRANMHPPVGREARHLDDRRLPLSAPRMRRRRQSAIWPSVWRHNWIRVCWTVRIRVGLTPTVVFAPHRSPPT